MADTLQDVNHIHVLPDFVQDGLDYLPGDFLRDKENLTTFLSVYLNRLKAIDEMLVKLSEGRLLANATYMNLDEIGRQLGVDRNGMGDDSYRAQITILLASASKHGTRPEVIQTLRQLFGDQNFTTWKGENYRVDIHVMSTCFKLEDLLEEIKDMLPLPTHLRLIESYGRAFGFNGDDDTFGFSSVNADKTKTTQGGISRLVYTSDEENTGYIMTVSVEDITVDASEIPPVGIIISISDAVLTESADSVTISPLTMAFGSSIVGTPTASKLVTISNDTDVNVTIGTLTLPTGYSLASGSAQTGTVIAPRKTADVAIVFNPQSVGIVSGNLAITTIGHAASLTVALSGVGEAAPVVGLQRLVTSGNQFVTTQTSENFRIKSVNWFGMEGTNYTPHGTWLGARYWKDIIDQIKTFGFNTIRIPLSGEVVQNNPYPPTAAVDWEVNSEFVGKTALEILDLIIDYCNTKEIYVILDHHRRTAGDGADGSPVDGSYTLSQWISSWTKLATRYKSAINVIGADVHNEPHDLDWSTWASYAEQAGNAIHAVTTDWIIFVEGVGQYNNVSYWWGGQLQGVASRPVTLTQPNRVAYSPHEYGQSVGSQSWLAYDNQTPPANWPSNLYGVWEPMWGYIFTQNIAPVWVGEFGGHFGVDGSGNLTKPHATYEKQWLSNLITYWNGDFNGDGVRDLAAGKKGISYSYWCYNPNSGDTGGLVQDNWTTPQTVKLNLLAPALSD
ncbi:hypothetical protein pEaSNUABM56_00102 [Erwinia phage pEa_SNUABM_56]|uniref:Putative glycoside hydrolase n=1 Tax=Erwinia phage pEp_SNUABM_01 TaxID=2601643 RepID=A0A5J6DB06_9CAUD|nr:baseplate protein [Erwinia phage pEp_SNUABM_01]QEQ94901.1 putative glycoside hydrolase [Erwinia phage pEp_SNUABM_01]UYL84831.1 hypothetical protein pEaSNUABM55_00033 [Erwinia phage pEa_SNUABM_55]UYL85147.1 hypothetical protein pEaSNUABM56_00102 [Erwinia phage pEa_SNUABM_56]